MLVRRGYVLREGGFTLVLLTYPLLSFYPSLKSLIFRLRQKATLWSGFSRPGGIAQMGGHVVYLHVEHGPLEMAKVKLTRKKAAAYLFYLRTGEVRKKIPCARYPTLALAIVGCKLPRVFTIYDVLNALGLPLSHRPSVKRALNFLARYNIIGYRLGGGRGKPTQYWFYPIRNWRKRPRRRRPRSCPRVQELVDKAKEDETYREHLYYTPRPRWPYWRDLAALFRRLFCQTLSYLPEHERNLASLLWSRVAMHHIKVCSLTVGESLTLWLALRNSLLNSIPRTQRQLLHLLYALTKAIRGEPARLQRFAPIYQRYHGQLPSKQPVPKVTAPRRVDHPPELQHIRSPVVELAQRLVWGQPEDPPQRCPTRAVGTRHIGEVARELFGHLATGRATSA